MATINEKLTAVANAIREKTGGTSTLTLDQMAADLNAIPNKTSSDLTASGATVTVPTGNYKAQATKSVATATQATPSVSIDANGLITASATQTAGYVSAGTKSGTKQLTVQAAKTVTPSTSEQTAVASGVYTTGAVKVAAIPSSYKNTSDATAAAGDILSGKIAYNSSGKITGSIATKTSSDLTASGATVTVPAGYYASSASKSVSTATRADTTISVTADDTNDKLTITASNNQGTGYVTGANKTASTTISLTASGATVTASDGTNSVSKSVSTVGRADTTISVSADDTNDKLTITASNNQGTGYVTGANKTATKTITLTASGSSVTASDGTNSVSKSVATATQATPSITVSSAGLITASATQTAGYVSAGTKSGTKQLTTQAAKTITPSTSEQTAVASGVYTTGAIKVAAMTTATQATPSISIDSAGKITASATQTAGYVAAGTKTGTKQLTTQAAKTVTPSTSSQTAVASGVYTTGAVTVAAIPSSYVQPTATKAAATITPGTSNQTIAAGTYCSGAQTIAGDADLVAGNIKKGVNIFNVTGTYDAVADALNFTVVNGTSAPSSPTENTIWVNTSTAITGWDFSATQPYPRSTNKNIIVYPYVSDSTTKSGITWTVNSDGSIKANGTATANSSRYITHKTTTGFVLTLPAGTYKLSGCPSGGSSSTYYLELAVSYDNWATATYPKDTGSGATVTLTSTARVCMYAVVKSGKAVSNIVFKPQLEVGSSATSWVKGDATGHVWFFTNEASNIEFNALKNNGIQTRPMSVKQYVSGAWVDKTPKIYQGGAWKDWTVYIYNLGWAAASGFDYKQTDASYAVNVSYSNGYMTLQKTGWAGYAWAATKETFDLTGVNTIYCETGSWDENYGTPLRFGVGTSDTTRPPTAHVICSNPNTVYALDVSSLSGKYKIGFYCYNDDYSDCYWIPKTIKAFWY